MIALRNLVLLATLAFGLTAVSSAANSPLTDVIRDDLNFAAAQYTYLLGHIAGKEGFPRTTDQGDTKLVRANDWTSGFFPGSVWLLFDATRDPKWRDAAARYTAAMESVKTNRGTHDLGFMLYCSYGQGLRLTGDAKYREVLLTGAESLASRFSPKVGCIKSWDWSKQWKFPVIIDNMMNLEFMMWASRAANQPRFADIATRHADTTLRHHFRADASSVHVVDYDPATGKVLTRVTHQGAANDSAWARGQAWGLYGFTMMFRETKNPAYLAHAQKIAALVMNHPRLPADKIPYWDFDAPGIPNAPRDSSAAAIICSALLELRTFVPAADAARYTTFAEAQLRSLSSPAYRAKQGENGGFILLHATGNHPGKSEIDVPLTYGDYYFLEALLRAQAGLKAKS